MLGREAGGRGVISGRVWPLLCLNKMAPHVGFLRAAGVLEV